MQRLSGTPKIIIADYVLLTFYGYFTIGFTLAVLPVFITRELGFNTVVAGGVMSIQYIMTFLMRAVAGTIVDRNGPKRAVLISMTSFILSGLLLIAVFLTSASPLLSLTLLIGSRLLTGCGEGMVGASPINWALLRVGEKHTATAISYNGIANYSSLAFGAPLGLWMASSLGNWSLGAATILSALVGLWSAIRKPALYGPKSTSRPPFLRVLKSVSPYGSGLALAGIGFGTISTFITLYFVSRQWSSAALSITAFSTMFVAARLFFSRTINKYGGINVAMICMVAECLGLLMVWQAPSPVLAIAGAGMTGFGFSLVFPALGVEAVKRIPASSKGAALGGYGLFIDISLGITGPLVGFVANHFGLPAIFPFSAALALSGIGMCMILSRRP